MERSYVRYDEKTKVFDVKAFSRRYVVSEDPIYDTLIEKLTFLFPHTHSGENVGIIADYEYIRRMNPQFEDVFKTITWRQFSAELQLNIIILELERAKCGERKFDFRLFCLITGYLANTRMRFRGDREERKRRYSRIDFFQIEMREFDSQYSDYSQSSQDPRGDFFPLIEAHEQIVRGCLFLYVSHHSSIYPCNQSFENNPLDCILNEFGTVFHFLISYVLILLTVPNHSANHFDEGKEDPRIILDYYIALGLRFQHIAFETMTQWFACSKDCAENTDAVKAKARDVVECIAPRIFEMMKRDGFDPFTHASDCNIRWEKTLYTTDIISILHSKTMQKTSLFDILWNFLDAFDDDQSGDHGGRFSPESKGQYFMQIPKIDEETRIFFACYKIHGKGAPPNIPIILDLVEPDDRMLDPILRAANDICGKCSNNHLILCGMPLRISPKRFAIIYNTNVDVCRYGALNALECFIRELCSDPRVEFVSIKRAITY